MGVSGTWRTTRGEGGELYIYLMRQNETPAVLCLDLPKGSGSLRAVETPGRADWSEMTPDVVAFVSELHRLLSGSTDQSGTEQEKL